MTTKVQLVSNIVGNVSGGASFTGIVTATSFNGSLTGTASTASFATTSFGLSGTPNITVGVVTASSFVGNVTGTATGLSGSPNITVGNITGTAATFTGNVSIAGTLTYEDVTNVDSIGVITARSDLRVSGISSFSGEQRVTTIAEKSVISGLGNTISLTYGGSSANVAITTNPTGNITLNVTNIPTDNSFDNHNLSFSVIVLSTGTARTCTAVTLNGVSKTIRWAGGSLASAVSGVTTPSGYTIQSFAGINTIGSASTTTNYEVFGVVSGGFF